MKPARFAFFGSSSFGIPSLERLRADPSFELVAVITQPPRPSGRGKTPMPTPVGTWGIKQRIPRFEWASIKNQPDMAETLKNLICDFMLVAAYGCIVPADLLQLTRGWINLHASILPRHRGASPINAAIAAGDTISGVSIMQMDAGIDTGPVLQTLECPLSPTITTPELELALSQLPVETLPDTLQAWLNGTLRPTPQPSSGATYAAKLTKDDGHATWSSAVEWERKIRAYQPWPGVWANWQDTRIAFLAAHVESGHPGEKSGTVVAHKKTWGIVCPDGWLIPDTIQRAGGKPIPAGSAIRDWSGLLGAQLV